MNITANYDNVEDEITFDDYLKYEKLDLHIQIETNDKNINVEFLQSNVTNIINANQIKNIDHINLYVYRCHDESHTGEYFNNHTIYEQ